MTSRRFLTTTHDTVGNLKTALDSVGRLGGVTHAAFLLSPYLRNKSAWKVVGDTLCIAGGALFCEMFQKKLRDQEHLRQ